MGRARGYGASHAATSADQGRFDAVLGARRGSASAQATRDAQESQVREAALTKMISELKLASGTGTAIDCLTKAYRSGGAGVGTPEYKKLCTDLKPTQVNRFKDLAKVAVHGDPEHWPGLTAPAVAALGTYLHAAASGGEAASAPNKLSRAMITSNAILEHEDTPEQHERLAPALEGLAALLQHLPGHWPGDRSSMLMAEMLSRASTQALAGPMQPLVQAFRQRIIDGRISSDERRVLKRIVVDQIRNGQVEEAFRPVADVL